MADIFTNYLTGSDTTGNGSLATPYKTVAKALTVQVQGDTIKVMEDEPISTAWTLPTRSSRVTLNIIMGVNSLGVEDGTRRVISSSGGLGVWLSQNVNTYEWLLKNLQIGASGAGFATNWIQHSSISIQNPLTFYNCKLCFSSPLITNFNATVATDRMVFRRCVFEDLTHNANLSLFGNSSLPCFYFVNCTFRRCSITGATSYNIVNAFSMKLCSFIDCSALRYGPNARYLFEDIVIDRFVFTGTGNVDNVVTGFNLTVSDVIRYSNVLISNIQFANTPTTTSRALFTANTVSGQIVVVENIAYWNADVATPFKRVNTAVSMQSENFMIALTESPWKNDDGIIANPMSCYEYKDGYPWRRKNQLLTDISGWSYPT